MASLRAVLTAEQLAEVEARHAASSRAGACNPRSAPREVRDLLRAPAPAALGRRLRVHADPGRARADRARRLARHRLRLGGRAPLPRGVQPLSAPEVFLAAASQRTRRIRLGHGIVQTPPPFNHPARVAERIAMLDLVSGGRVDFGTGESSSEAELGGFGIDPEQKRAMWEEGLRVALRCMTETPFTGHAGEYVTMPPRNVVPKPRAEAAPAGLGGVQPARDHPPRRAAGHRRARVRVHRSRRGAPLGRPTTTTRSRTRACRSATR